MKTNFLEACIKMRCVIAQMIDDLVVYIMTMIVFCGGMRFDTSAYADEQRTLAERRM